MCAPAAPVSVRTCPPAASTRRTGEPASRLETPEAPNLSLGGGASQPRARTAIPAPAGRPCLGSRAGAPGAGRAPPPCGRSARAARAARPRPRVRDLTAARSSRLRAHTGVMAERQPQAKFPGADGLPLQPRHSSGVEKRRGGDRSARGQRSRGGCGREAPGLRNRGDGKRKAPGVYNQNVG